MGAADWLALSDMDDDIGQRLRDRRLRMGISVRHLAEEAEVDRGRLAKLEAGSPTVRDTTIGKVEAALTRLEHEMGMDPEAGNGDAMVEFRVSGNLGVDVVVKGPVKDLQALEASVARIVAQMQGGTEESPATS